MNDLIFSWAEDANGKIVHVDNVRQDLSCGCSCPYCHERLMARHGEIRAHGFAHRSDQRGATNLKICYMVIMYKLAEQIIQQEKKIKAPSYYGIFKKRLLEFKEVAVDDRYDREDKQPDVIATTADGIKYLIEFTFAYKVQHKEQIDYKDLNCIEIDLSSQTLESLHDFLIESSEHRKWLNNQNRFENIEFAYSNTGRLVKIKSISDCQSCSLNHSCCGIRLKGSSSPIVIENNGLSYKVCKVEEFNNLMKQLEEKRKLIERSKEEERMAQIRFQENVKKSREKTELELKETALIDSENRSCFMCKSNLDWACINDNYAHCGAYMSMKVPKKTPPETAKTCRGFRIKLNNE